MPTLAEKITIASPPDEVWPLLSDPALVASCIPGATLSPDQDGDVWKGSIRVKFGPTVAIFKGEATLTYDHDQKRCTIEGRGIDGRGASRALANGLVTATGTTETELTVEGEYSVTGPLETFANAGGVHVARALLAEFAKNMGALVDERRGGTSPADATVSASSAAAVTPSEASASSTPTTSTATTTAAAAAAATASATHQPTAATAASITPTTTRSGGGPCYVIADTRVQDEAAFALYREIASTSVAKHGGRYLARGGAIRSLEGEWSPERLIVIAFPTRAAAEAWYASDDYRPALTHKHKAMTRNLLLVDGLPGALASLAQPGTSSGASASPRPRQATELNASTLMWAAFKSWISESFRQTELITHEQAQDPRHARQGLRGRRRRHALHPDGRRQHVLVDRHGRAAGHARHPCPPRELRRLDGRRLCPRHRQGRRRLDDLRPGLHPDHDLAHHGLARQHSAGRLCRRQSRLPPPGTCSSSTWRRWRLPPARTTSPSATSTACSTTCARPSRWPRSSASPSSSPCRWTCRSSLGRT